MSKIYKKQPLDKENTNIADRKPIIHWELTKKEQQEIDKAYEEHKKTLIHKTTNN